MSFGKLILTPKEGPPQEFSLAKGTVTIGRSATSDIALEDRNVSRNHSMLKCNSFACTVVDLGSANGTKVNGERVDRATLKAGDIITIAANQLRFETSAPDVDDDMTRFDSPEDLETGLLQTSLKVQLEETGVPSLTVHLPGKTWEVPLLGDAVTIGRLAENNIVIESQHVSRNHARVERKGDSFVMRDLGGSVGTWLGEQRITEHTLRSGDTFRIGPALVIFKSGFNADELMGLDELTQSPWKRRPIVVIPGFGGSNLWRGSEQLWPNVRKLFGDGKTLRIAGPDEPPADARGLVNQVVVIPNLIKLEEYGRLTDYLSESLGYERGKDLIEFAYDFRHDIRLAAQRLSETIDAWKVKPPITLICHSLGCLVGRYYIERLGGKKKVGRLLLMGGPHAGAAKTFSCLLLGPHLFPFGVLDEKLRETLATHPSTYMTLPDYPCATDQAGRSIDIMGDDTWLPPERRYLLARAREFKKELGTSSSVPTVCIFGYGIKTITKIWLERDSQGLPKKAATTVEQAGDSTVPESSAILAGAEIHPVRQQHGLLYADSDVRMRLKLELTR